MAEQQQNDEQSFEENEAQQQQQENGESIDANKIEAYSFPEIQFDVQPYRYYHFHRQFRSSSNPNNFLKSVKWSPDGSCFLTSSEDNTLRLFSLPGNESDYPAGSFSSGPHEDSYAANLVINEGESVYDYCWFPYMSASDITSCVFATTTRDHPIHLWDSTTGELRCTYRAFDAMDEITAAFSIGFNPTGTKIFAGYNKALRVFDVHRPGKDFKQHSTLQGSKEGQSGIISAIAFSPANSGLLATGSYDQTTAIYREDNMELLYVLHGQEGGVTHVQFSKDGNYLYTGARKGVWAVYEFPIMNPSVRPSSVRICFYPLARTVDKNSDPYIMCWDIRNTVEVVYKLYRSTEHTNQRISFDIEPNGRHLGTGGQDGLVHIYDLQTGQWTSSFAVASDTVNGFSFHPFLPMAVTSSGHRRFSLPDDADDEEVVTTSSNENCASVWGFSYTTAAEDMMTINDTDSIAKFEDEKQ